MQSHKGIVHAESYLPPANITIRSLGKHYLCDGIRSVCWACECADHCEYGRIYCRMLRERVKKQKHGWRGYELAAAAADHGGNPAGAEAERKTLGARKTTLSGEEGGINRMTINEYQKLAQRTSPDDHNKLLNGCMGLAGECGEVCDVMKKALFQGHKLDRAHMIEELGDCAWYLAEAASGLGVSLEDILLQNIAKLKRRYPAGFDPERSVHREAGA